MITGMFGMGFYIPSWSNHPSIIEPIFEANEEAKIIILPPPIGPDGLSSTGVYPGRYYQTTLRGVLASSKVSDEKLIRMMQVLDYAWTDPVGRWQMLYGIEGETYRWIDKENNIIDKFTADKIKDEYVTLMTRPFYIMQW